MQKRLIAGLILSNIIVFALMWAYKEKFESKAIEAGDYKVFLKEERELRFKDSRGYEHLRKEVEAIGNGNSLKGSPEWMELIGEIKGLKAKNVLAASKTTIKSEYFVSVRDSIVNDTLSCYNYEDKFLVFNGCDGKFNISTTDSISQVIYKGKRANKFLFFRVGPRVVESEIISYNPHSKVTYQKNVIVKKKK